MDLPTLKRLSKNDPIPYKNEILARLEYLYAKLETAKLRPKLHDREIGSLASFLASVSGSFNFGGELCTALASHLEEDLAQKTRDSLMTATFTLRSRRSVPLSDVLPVWLKQVELKDKAQRERLLKFLVRDLISAKKKGEDLKLVRKLFMDKLNASLTSNIEGEVSLGRFILTLLIKLFERGVWRDRATANVMAECSLAFDKKIAAAGSRLVLDASFKPSSSEEEVPVTPIRVIEYLRDPNGFSMALLKRSCGDKVPFSTRLMLLNVCTRVIGHYKLVIPSIYTQIAKYLNPKQRMVTHILAYLLQATHELTPPDMLHPILEILVNQFIAFDRPDAVILTGLHTVRELVKRSSCLTESIKDYIKDFIKYRHKDISAVAKTIAGKGVKPGPEYGHVEVYRGVEGEELLSEGHVSATRILGQDDFMMIKNNTNKKNTIIDSIQGEEDNDSIEEEFDSDDIEGTSSIEDNDSENDTSGTEVENDVSNSYTNGTGALVYPDLDTDSSSESESSPELCKVDPEALKFGSKAGVTRAEKRAAVAKIMAEKKEARRKAISKHGKRQSLSKNVQARNKPIMMVLKSKKMKKKKSMNIAEKAQTLKRHIKNLAKGRINKKKRRS